MEKNNNPMTDVCVIIPARNEAASISQVVAEVHAALPAADILVINDGSDDDTASRAKDAGARIISHPYSIGNGAAIKDGLRHASGSIAVMLDADGQHKASDIPPMLAKLEEGYDMVVGARSSDTHANKARRLANNFYNRLASWMVGRRILDLTSGFRAVRLDKARQFLHLLPNGFSYPTTITMSMFRSGYPVTYIPIHARKRTGKSHIRPLRDGLRFLLIIFRVGAFYSPLKIFFPTSIAFFMGGLGYYLYTYLSTGRFTNMVTVLFIISIVIFLIGLISEQITALMFRDPRH